MTAHSCSKMKGQTNVYLSPAGAAAEAAGDLVRLCGAGNFRSSPRLPPRRLRSRDRDLLRRKFRDRDGDIRELRDYIFARRRDFARIDPIRRFNKIKMKTLIRFHSRRVHLYDDDEVMERRRREYSLALVFMNPFIWTHNDKQDEDWRYWPQFERAYFFNKRIFVFMRCPIKLKKGLETIWKSCKRRWKQSNDLVFGNMSRCKRPRTL